MPDLKITTISHGDAKTHFVSTPTVNWVMLQDQTGVTLVDGGYPGHAGAVLEGLSRIGSAPQEIRGALLTHAHVDHLGGLARLRREHRFDVFADPDEVTHARRDYLEQADASTIGPLAYRPAVVAWLGRIVRLGALDKDGIPDTQAFIDPSTLPGSPTALATHGHTRGHSAFLSGDGEVLISGDSMISGHPISKRSGPQCLDEAFTHDVAANESAVAALADLDSVVIMPGHGPMLCGAVETFVEQALTHSGA